MRSARLALIAALAMIALPASAGAQSRIVGGGAASPGEYPAQAYLRIDLGAVSLSCGGTLISKTKVATAAHCLDAANYALPVVPVFLPVAPDLVSVSLGSNRAGQGATQTAASLEIHPDYDPSTSANDIAVITLPEPATQAPLGIVDPAVDAAGYAVGRPATVIGWGTTSAGGSASADLLEVEVPVVSDADCDDANSYDGTLVTDVMLCAGLPQGGKDSCQGDSGGPLMTRSTGVLKLTGIVSFGEGCAGPEKYGVYTEVPAPAIRNFLIAQAGAPPTVTVDPVSGATVGRASALHATAADPTSGGGIATVSWDLDGDGVFGDAAGADVSWTPASAGERPVRARVTDTDGMVAVAERVVTVAAGATTATTTTPSPTPTPAPATTATATPAPPAAPGAAPAPATAAPAPASTPAVVTPRARLTKVSAKGRTGTLRVRGTVRGNPCTAGKVRITVTRGGRRAGRKLATVRRGCTFSADFRLRGRLRISIEFLGSDGRVTKLGTRTRRVR